MSAADTEVSVRVFGGVHAFRMPRDGRTVLDAARAAGVDLPYSCEAGCCSTCRARLVSGRLHMRNNLILDDDECAAGYVLACQAVPDSETVCLDFDS